MKKLFYITVIALSIAFNFNHSNAQINAGFDITFIVGVSPIDLFTNASTTDGTWTVSGGNLNGSTWDAGGYQAFTEPFRDFTASLTENSTGESDSKSIRAYNRLDPFVVTRSEPFSICENGAMNLPAFDFDISVPYLEIFNKRFFYQKNSAGAWVEYNNPLSGNLLGPGTHKIRERYSNVVLSFAFTDVETTISVRTNPVLFWDTAIPQLCSTSAPIDITSFLNTTTNVVITSNAGAAFTGTTFDPSVSGVGEFTVTAVGSSNNCTTVIGYVIKVVDPCN